MKRRNFCFIITFCLIIMSLFILSACEETYKVGYVQITTTGEQVVQYGSSQQLTKIYLYENQQAKDNEGSDGYLLYIEFGEGGYVSEDEGGPASFCAINNYYRMTIYVNPDYYSADKKVYLNGTDITSTIISEYSKTPELVTYALGDYWSEAIYWFENFGLKDSSKTNYINTIEYKV